MISLDDFKVLVFIVGWFFLAGWLWGKVNKEN